MVTINTKCNSEARFIHYLGVSNHVLDALSLYRNAVYRQVMEGVIPIELPAKPREYVHVSLTLPFEERPRSGVKCGYYGFRQGVLPQGYERAWVD